MCEKGEQSVWMDRAAQSKGVLLFVYVCVRALNEGGCGESMCVEAVCM